MIGGVFTNSGLIGFGRKATVTIGTLDNTASGNGDMAGTVTVTNIDNAGGRSGSFAGFGADRDLGESGGDLDVTGTLTNTGDFGIGNSGVKASETATMAALDNESTGKIAIANSTVTVGDVDNTAAAASNGSTGFYVDYQSADSGGLLHVTGTFTNDGGLGIGADGTETTVIINTLDNGANGGVDIDGASVTIDNVNNAGRSEGDVLAGFGVNYPSANDTSETGGSLTVTGVFTNTGDFAVGSILTGGGPSATTATIQTFENKSTGGVQILAGTVTITTLTNAGAPSASVSHAGIGIDNLPAQPGGGALTVTGVFTNTGDFVIGNLSSEMTGSATANVGTLDNNGGTIDLIGGGKSGEAELELGTTPSTWKGALSLVGGTEAIGGTPGFAGTALVAMEDNGQIATIAAGGLIALIGDHAFVADADNTSASSALAGLKTIDGALGLEQGAEAEVTGNLTNNGLANQNGGIAVDHDNSSFGSSLTIDKELTNNGSIGLGNSETSAVDDEEALAVGALDNTATGSIGIVNTALEVKGNATNFGVGAGNGIGLDIVAGASGGALTVGGELTNDGVIGVGNASDDGSTTVTLGSLDNEAAGSFGVTDAALTVTGTLTNAGVGAGEGIGVDIAPGASGGSLEVDGTLTNTGDIVIGNTSGEGSTSVDLAAVDNGATGSIAIDDAAAKVSGDLTNAGVGTNPGGIQNGIGVDFATGASGGSLTVTDALTNTGVIGIGNAGDDGSTEVSLGSLDNEAPGSIGIVNAAVTVTANLTNSGRIDVDNVIGASSGSLTVEGTLTNSGAFNMGNSGDKGSTAVMLGALDNQAGGTFGIENAILSVKGTVTNAGLFEKTGGAGTTAITASFTDTGAVAVATGTLSFSGSTNSFAGAITGAGRVLFAGGASTLKSGATASVAKLSTSGSGTKLTVAENLSYAGAFTEGAGTTLSIASGDKLTLTGTSGLSGTTSGAGTLDLAGGSATIDSGATVTASIWTISGAGTDVTLGENLTYTGSFSEGAGDTFVLSGGHLLLSGSDTFTGGTVDGSKVLETEGTTVVSGLTIGGTVEWENTKTVKQSGGTVTIGNSSGDKAFLDNTATGTYDIAGNGAIGRGSSTASDIKNAGLFEKTGGTKTSTIAPAVTNDGTVRVSSGTLELKGAVTGKGTDTISGASTLELGAGVSTAATLGDQDIGFTGGGTLRLLAPTSFYGEISDFGSGDTVELKGSWAFSGISDVAGVTTLTLASGATTHAFDFVGNYAQGDFKITSGATSTITHT